MKHKHLPRAVFAHWPVATETSVAVKIFIRFAEEKCARLSNMDADNFISETHLTQPASVLLNLCPSGGGGKNLYLRCNEANPCWFWFQERSDVSFCSCGNKQWKTQLFPSAAGNLFPSLLMSWEPQRCLLWFLLYRPGCTMHFWYKSFCSYSYFLSLVYVCVFK